MHKALWNMLVFLLLCSSNIHGESELTRVTPAKAGMSAKKLRTGIQLFQNAVKKDDIRGAVLLVVRKGKIVLHEAVGWRDYEKKLPMLKDTMFHVASNTKPVIAAAVLMLADAGKCRLNEPVSKYLPAFDNNKCKEIQIRHLLNHTSGFRIPGIFLRPLILKSKDHPDAPSLQLEVKRFAKVGPKVKPGTSYSYNNPGYNTLGALIEVISKEPLETFLTNNIYKKLNMKDSGHQQLSKSQIARRAVIYRRRSGKWETKYQPGDKYRFPFVRASGGLITTAEDYARFCYLFLNQGRYGGKQLLKKETVLAATTPQTQHLYSKEEQSKQENYYGYGWMVWETGIYGHGGSDGTFAWIDPKNEVIGIIFTQSPGGKIPREEFMDIVRQAVIEK